MSKDHPTVLLVDDDDGVRFTLREVLEELDVAVEEAADGQAAIERLDEGPVDLVITDLRMPRADGMAVLRHAVDLHPGIKVVMITAHGSESAAVEAMKNGAFDYFPKPFDVDDVARVVTRATETARLVHENRRLRAALHLSQHMIFRSEKMRRIAEVVERVGPKDVTVLIHGESGTGKELGARARPEESRRASRPCRKVSCAAVPTTLMESELFGHEKGAFTGAVSSKPGRFELADGGTLFLDEIAEIPPEMQVKLLRVLQESEFERVGGVRTIRVDVRLVAATNRDLKAEIDKGTFREDLFYRLNVVPVALAPLRDRRDDIPGLLDFFVGRFNERLGKRIVGIEPDALEALTRHDWPGNIRELENIVERAVLFADGDRLCLVDLPPEVTRDGSPGAPAPTADVPLGDEGLKQQVKAATSRLERQLITRALDQTGGNVTHAARLLKISRKGLQLKMKELELRERGD
ncbi:MAG: sigma-54 dependent transcriptional regulator [Deltaproteobacteria bacterium]